MRSFLLPKTLLVLVIALAALLQAQNPATPVPADQRQTCPSDDSGLKLPPGFCATVWADGMGHARHVAVAPNGVVYVNTWSGVYYGNEPPHPGGFLVALQDKAGAGKADVVERFGETAQTGGAGGTGIGIYKNWVYAEINDRIVRYSMSSDSIVPKDEETIVSGLPLGGDHPMHPFVIDAHGQIFVDVASATNACQIQNRTRNSPGANPCTELETRGGIWRFDANKTDQVFSPAERFATGIRNGDGFAIDESGRLFVAQQGRDQLHSNWPDLYRPDEEATLPAEEVLLLKEGGDYGWPECYYDPFVQKLVLAPEYGGDGKKKVGVCATKTGPVAAFPAHWAPNDITYYDKTQFPRRYRHGIYVAFHGSWNRAPYPQGGYNVVFQPFADGHPAGRCEIFADGFAGGVKSPDRAARRPAGLAVGPDGALYIADDVRGRIYRVVYVGGSANSAGQVTYCPSAASPAGKIAETVARPPEGTHPHAGNTRSARMPVPEGATREMVVLGRRIYRGEVGGAQCTACHGISGQGSVLGPRLTSNKYLWGDGSYKAITKIIVDGVAHPQKYRNVMPPEGGAQLSKDQIAALAAYVWSLGHGEAATSSSHAAPSPN
jgi:glucose/arabinose dehydrogenase/mono/diheme cytochrome c family protein